MLTEIPRPWCQIAVLILRKGSAGTVRVVRRALQDWEALTLNPYASSLFHALADALSTPGIKGRRVATMAEPGTTYEFTFKYNADHGDVLVYAKLNLQPDGKVVIIYSAHRPLKKERTRAMNSSDDRLERISTHEAVTIRNTDGSTRTIRVTVPALRDPATGEIFLDAEAIAMIDKARARHLGVLAPQEIAKLRERLGMTQRQLADALQIGAKTWTRWETGREVPSRSMNLLLLALYEGKLDVAYLRAKQTKPNQPSPDPVLRAYGWEDLVARTASLPWRHEEAPLQRQFEFLIQSLIGRPATRERTATAEVSPTHAQPPARATGATEIATGKTEELPLSA